MKYAVVLIDGVCCSSFVDWTYEEEATAPGREGLLKLQLESAMSIARNNKPLIYMTSQARNALESKYCNDERGMCHVSSLVECAGQIAYDDLADDEALLKFASILSWKKINYCILTGNSLLHSKAQNAKLNVLELSESLKLF